LEKISKELDKFVYIGIIAHRIEILTRIPRRVSAKIIWSTVLFGHFFPAYDFPVRKNHALGTR
tara:strand:+ start:1761 stop:1949 length:189 start_codon:yes stop_codon:yes gene_type:complete